MNKPLNLVVSLILVMSMIADPAASAFAASLRLPPDPPVSPFLRARLQAEALAISPGGAVEPIRKTVKLDWTRSLMSDFHVDQPPGPGAPSQHLKDAMRVLSGLFEEIALMSLKIMRANNLEELAALTQPFLDKAGLTASRADLMLELAFPSGAAPAVHPGVNAHFLRNVLGRPYGADYESAIRTELAMLRDSFAAEDASSAAAYHRLADDLASRHSPIGIRPFAERVLALTRKFLENGLLISEAPEFSGLVGYFFANSPDYTQSRGFVDVVVLPSERDVHLFVQSGLPLRDALSIFAHEAGHVFLDQLNPDYISYMKGRDSGTTDWFTTAFSLLTLDRLGAGEALVESEPPGGFEMVASYRVKAFYLHLRDRAPVAASLQSILQDMRINRYWGRYLSTPMGHDELFYLEGAVLSAEALRAARVDAAREWRSQDADYIYQLARRRVVAAAKAGPYQTYAQAVEIAGRRVPSPAENNVQIRYASPQDVETMGLAKEYSGIPELRKQFLEFIRTLAAPSGPFRVLHAQEICAYVRGVTFQPMDHGVTLDVHLDPEFVRIHPVLSREIPRYKMLLMIEHRLGRVRSAFGIDLQTRQPVLLVSLIQRHPEMYWGFSKSAQRRINNWRRAALNVLESGADHLGIELIFAGEKYLMAPEALHDTQIEDYPGIEDAIHQLHARPRGPYEEETREILFYGGILRAPLWVKRPQTTSAESTTPQDPPGGFHPFTGPKPEGQNHHIAGRTLGTSA